MQIFKIIMGVIVFTSSCAFTTCQAQDIVGKWKMISSTSYFTAEGAARQGESSHTNPVPSTASIISDFKPDHTYITITSSASSPTPTSIGGTWNLAGDRLTVTIDPKYKPLKGKESSTISISIKGNSMILTNNIVPNAIVTKMTTQAERI